jgi:LPS export ABC transporter protein LptC
VRFAPLGRAPFLLLDLSFVASRNQTLLLFAALAIPTGKPSIEINTFHLVESEKDTKAIELWSEKTRVFKPDDIMVLDNLTADFFNQNDPTPYRAKGKIGVFKNSTQDFKIFGESELLSPESYQFLTEDLLFKSDSKTLTSNSKVNAFPTQKTGSGFKITGKGLQVWTLKSEYEIQSDVVAQQNSKDSGSITIASKSVLIQPRQNSAEFLKNIKVKSPDLELQGDKLEVRFNAESEGIESLFLSAAPSKILRSPGFITAELPQLKLKSNGLKVYFSTSGAFERSEAIGQASGQTQDGVLLEANKLESIKENGSNRIELKEKVKIVTEGRNATCEEATFFPDTGEIILYRTATIQKEDQLIEGEKIRFSTKNSEIRVERAKGTMDQKELFKKGNNP